MKGVQVRAYQLQDRSSCLAVFDSNVPESFTQSERSGFETFLDTSPGPYFVLALDSGRIVACGGYARAAGTSCADLCWGMVERAHQNTGLGRLLTEARLQRIRDDGSFTEVALRTSQFTEAFYQRLGFVTERFTIDGIAPGLHKVEMRLTLAAP